MSKLIFRKGVKIHHQTCSVDGLLFLYITKIPHTYELFPGILNNWSDLKKIQNFDAPKVPADLEIISAKDKGIVGRMKVTIPVHSPPPTDSLVWVHPRRGVTHDYVPNRYVMNGLKI